MGLYIYHDWDDIQKDDINIVTLVEIFPRFTYLPNIITERMGDRQEFSLPSWTALEASLKEGIFTGKHGFRLKYSVEGVLRQLSDMILFLNRITHDMIRPCKHINGSGNIATGHIFLFRLTTFWPT